jgi:hypothetical protein
VISHDEELWNIFLIGRPDLAGSRHDDPDPENKVWPDFVEWRDQIAAELQSAAELRSSRDEAFEPRMPGESRAAFRLRTGLQR